MTTNVDERNKPYIEKLIAAMGKELDMKPLSCPCGRTESIPLADRDRWEIPIQVKLCACGLVRTDPYFTREALDIVYKDYYRNIDLMYSEAEWIEWETCNVGNVLINTENAVKLPGKKVFEIGCGLGAGVKTITDRGYEVVGFDTNIEDAKRLYPDLHFEEDWENYPEKADLIIMVHTFEHLPDPVWAASKLKNLLNPNGIMAIVVPGLAALGDTYKHSLQQYLVFTHPFHYNLSTLGHVMHQAHFHLVLGNELVQSYWTVLDEPIPDIEPIGESAMALIVANEVVRTTAESLRTWVVPNKTKNYLIPELAKHLDQLNAEN